jgi:predicted nucleic acid-binding protein
VTGEIAINDVVYAELSIRYTHILDLDQMLVDASIAILHTPRAALFLAGKASRQYRAGGGTRTGVLPDFFIGAHAMVEGGPLLTRDIRRYRGYFPNVLLIAPAP